jgi:hypothetical protein
VYAVNDCGTSVNARTITITRANPSTPSLISGPTNACAYIGSAAQTATYFVNAVAGVDTYTWTLPVGATNVTGQGTNMVSFKYPAGYTSGTVSVVAANGCGTSNARVLTVGRLTAAIPSQIDVINVSACPDRVYTYSISAIPSNATSLVWNVPTGATLVSGQGTTSITVSYPGTTIDGNVVVQSLNNCSLSGARISRVKLGACASGIAASNNPQSKAITSATEMNVQVYPNPTTSAFTVLVKGIATASNIKVKDIQGRVVKTINTTGTTTIGNELKSGVYFIEVRNGNEVKTMRVVKY